jgi:hypothetical protein
MKKYLLLAIALFMYGLNNLTPLYSDDYAYCFFFKEIKGFDVFHLVTNISDIFHSQYNHYFTMNGRSIVHSIVQLFLGLLGKDVFNIINSLVFICLIYLIYKLAVTEKEKTPQSIILLLLFFSLFFLTNAFGETFLWLTGSVNYLWSATLMLVILLIHSYLVKNQLRTISLPFLFIIGIIGGWSNESFSIGLSGGFFIFYLLNIKLLRFNNAILILGFFIGTLLILFSPGTLARANESGVLGGNLILKFSNGLLKLFSSKIFSCLAVFLIYIFLKNKIFLKKIYHDKGIVLLALLVQIFFLVVIGGGPERAYLGIEILSLIIIFSVISDLYILNKYHLIILNISYSLIFLFCIAGSYLFVKSWSNYQANKKFISLIIASKDGIVGFDNQDKFEFVKHHLSGFPDNGFDSNHYCNRAMAGFYKKEKLIVLPAHFYKDLRKNLFFNNSNLFKGDLYTSNGINFYIKKIDPSVTNTDVKYYYSGIYNDLNFFNKILSKFSSKFDGGNYTVNNTGIYLKIDGITYLLIDKNPFYSGRITNIEVNSTFAN